MPPTNETQASGTRAPTTKIAYWIRGNFCSCSRTPSNSYCDEKNEQLNQGEKLLLKHAVKWKGSNQRKRRKVMAATKEPNIQSTKRDAKHMQNKMWLPHAMNSLDIFKFWFSMYWYFNSSLTETSHHFTTREDMNSINWPRSQCVAS